MTLRATALVALFGARGVSAAACPAAQNPMMSSVTSLAPDCFSACPQVCGPLDKMLADYMKDFDTEAIQAKICEDPEAFKCMLQKQPENHFKTCKPVLDAARSFAESFPMSENALDAACAALGNTPAGPKSTDEESPAKDIQPKDDIFSPDDNGTTESTTEAGEDPTTTTGASGLTGAAPVRSGVAAAAFGLVAIGAAAI